MKRGGLFPRVRFDREKECFEITHDSSQASRRCNRECERLSTFQLDQRLAKGNAEFQIVRHSPRWWGKAATTRAGDSGARASQSCGRGELVTKVRAAEVRGNQFCWAMRTFTARGLPDFVSSSTSKVTL
jgi:hypothetical protein